MHGLGIYGIHSLEIAQPSKSMKKTLEGVKGEKEEILDGIAWQ